MSRKAPKDDELAPLDEVSEEDEIIGGEDTDEEEGTDEDDFEAAAIDSGRIEVQFQKSPIRRVVVLKEHTTTEMLSRTEMAAVLANAIKQLAAGRPPFVDTKGLDTAQKIAIEELRQRKLPFTIRRQVLNPKYDDEGKLIDDGIKYVEDHELRKMTLPKLPIA